MIAERLVSYSGAIAAGGLAGNVAAFALCKGLCLTYAASDGSGFAAIGDAFLVIATAIDPRHHTPIKT